MATPNQAWPTMISDFNSADPSQSYIMTKAQDSHFSPTGHLLPAATWLAAVTKVTNAMNSAGGSAIRGNFVTADVPVPTGLPTYSSSKPLTATNYKVMTFDLSTFGTAFQGATIQFKIALEPTTLLTNTYNIYDVTLVNGSANSLEVSNIYINLNDKTDSIQGLLYDEISLNVRSGDNPFISPLPTLLAQQGTSDVISISADVAQAARPNTCLNLTNFQNNIFPIFSQPNMLTNANNTLSTTTCTSCHGGANKTATAAFNMTATLDPQTLCQNFLDRVNPQEPDQSALIYTPSSDPVHASQATASFFPAGTRATIVDWMANP